MISGSIVCLAHGRVKQTSGEPLGLSRSCYWSLITQLEFVSLVSTPRVVKQVPFLSDLLVDEQSQ